MGGKKGRTQIPLRTTLPGAQNSTARCVACCQMTHRSPSPMPQFTATHAHQPIIHTHDIRSPHVPLHNDAHTATHHPHTFTYLLRQHVKPAADHIAGDKPGPVLLPPDGEHHGGRPATGFVVQGGGQRVMAHVGLDPPVHRPVAIGGACTHADAGCCGANRGGWGVRCRDWAGAPAVVGVGAGVAVQREAAGGEADADIHARGGGGGAYGGGGGGGRWRRLGCQDFHLVLWRVWGGGRCWCNGNECTADVM